MSIKGQKLTDRQKKDIVEKICDEYAKGENTIDLICKAYGNIGTRTFQNWVNQNPTFKEKYERVRS